MAHIQYKGTRILGGRIGLISGKSLNLELWGPKKDNGGEYLLVSSDPSILRLERGDYLATKNVQVYKATANGYSNDIEIDLVDGQLQDGKTELASDNLKKPFVSCDSADLYVQADPGQVPFADYFQEVIPAIWTGLSAYNATNAPALTNKAAFLLVQSYNEQSPGVTGRPSLNSNRMFNVQALVTRGANNKITGTVAGQEEEGVHIEQLAQGEGPTNSTRALKTSPTFVYDSGKIAVLHYISVLKKRYREAYEVLTIPNSSFSSFADALQRAKFATDGSYSSTMKGLVDQVMKQAKAWLDFRLKCLDHDLSTTQKGNVYTQRYHDALVDFRQQLLNFKR